MNVFYLLASLAGIAGLVGLSRLLFGRPQPRLDADAASALLAQELPGFRLAAIVVAKNGRAALVEDAARALFVVAAVGDGLVARGLAAGTRIRRNGDTLRLGFGDVTFPAVTLALADEREARAWEEKLAHPAAA